YAATDPNFTGFGKFTAYVPPNVLPQAAFTVPRRAVAGQRIKLDASRSSDSDGHIVDYSWDLDGDGAMDVSTHTSPKLTHAFAPGVHHLTVRVTDDKGARAYANATVVVTHRRKR